MFFIDASLIPWLKSNVLPLFPDISETNPILIVCDGHGSHCSLEALKFCKANHIEVILRVPHGSHLLNPEDAVNFGIFKPAVRKEKGLLLSEKLKKDPNARLTNRDFVKITKEPFQKAFSPEMNAKAWAKAGYLPPNRRPLWEIIAKEKAKVKSRPAHIAGEGPLFNALTVQQLLHDSADSGGASDEEAETWRGGRLGPAELGCLDHPVTYDQSIALLQEKHG